MQSFVEFIRMLLQRDSGLSRKSALELVNEKTIHIFRRAFTHKSANMGYDYELLETIGDSILNATIKQFLVDTKKGMNPESITRIYHNLINKKSFGNMARSLGFIQYIVCDPIELKTFETKILEDVFEAFAGTIITVINMQKGINGLGYVVVSAFMVNILSKMHIETDIRKITPFVSQLEEVSKQKGFRDIYGINSDIEIRHSEGLEDTKTATVYVVTKVIGPSGKKTTTDKEILSKYNHSNIKGAREGAAELALNNLKERYSIEWRS